MLNKILTITLSLVIASTFMYTNMARAQIVKEGLVSYWTFDEEDVEGKIVRDSLGINDATIEGNTSLDEGIIGKAIVLDGDGDYVNCGNDESLNFEREDEFSLQAWVKKELEANQVVISRMLSAGSFRGWILWLRDNGILDLTLRNDWPSRNLLGVKTQDILSLSEWHHIVVTYDGSSEAGGIKVYIDGVEASVNIAYDSLTDTIKSDLNVNIGARDDGKTLLNGAIDEVAIYNRILDEDEVKQNFAATDNTFAVAQPDRKLIEVWGKIKHGQR